MKNRLLTLLLLFSISFNIAHAYVIAEYDAHPCEVHEYVHEFQNAHGIEADDICHLHHFFHMAFILPPINIVLFHDDVNTLHSQKRNTYTYNSHKNFLKPPIFA